jgi:hypothetical protein
VEVLPEAIQQQVRKGQDPGASGPEVSGASGAPKSGGLPAEGGDTFLRRLILGRPGPFSEILLNSTCEAPVFVTTTTLGELALPIFTAPKSHFAGLPN